MAEPVPPAVAVLEVAASGPQAMSTLVGLVLPLLVGLVTTSSWQPAAKGLLLLACSSGVAAGTVFIDRAGADAGVVLGPVDWRAIVASTFTTWLAAQGAHGGIWRRTELAHRLQAVGTRKPSPDPAAAVATIERAQGPTPPCEPARSAAPGSARGAVRPSPQRPRPRDGPSPRLPPAPDADPTPSGRHALLDPDEPTTLPER